MAQRAGDSGPEQALSLASLGLLASFRQHSQACRSASRTTQAESQLTKLVPKSI